jgi:hypothetical protein
MQMIKIDLVSDQLQSGILHNVLSLNAISTFHSFSCNKFFATDYPSISSVQGCHERGVFIFSQHFLSPELEIACCASVMDESALKSQISSSSCGCINAHVAHCTADGDLVNLCLLERIEKGCLTETGQQLACIFSGRIHPASSIRPPAK